MKKTSWILWFPALLAACSLAPEFQLPTLETPQQWNNTQAPSDTTRATDAAWWAGFKSAELSSYVAAASEQNEDIRAAAARIAQAQALATIAGGPLLPTLGVGGSIDKTNGSSRSSAFGTTSGASSSYQIGPQLSYEVDLFGRLRDAEHAAQSDVSASIYYREALRLSITAQVAESYFNLLALNERVGVAQTNVRNARAVLAAAQTKFTVGTFSRIDLSQQKTLTSNEEASLQTLLQQREAAHNALAILLGATPESFHPLATTLEGLSAPMVAATLPSAMLAHRPDIASIEAQMRAANFDIGVARAAFLPSLTLDAGLSLAAHPVSAAAQTLTSLAASISAPLFTNGTLEGGLDQATARQQELAANYRKAALTALGEVENALYAINTSQARLSHLATATREAQRAYDVGVTRYRVGASDYPTLLSVQTTLLQTQDAYAQARADRLSASVELFKALGGGWNEQK